MALSILFNELQIQENEKNMKNFLLIVLCISMLVACSNKQKPVEPTLTVTIEPLRYFTETIVGPHFKVVSMVPDGTSPETYDPTPQQLVALSKSTAYLQIGHIGFEQSWIQKLKDNTPNLPFYDTSKGIDLIYASCGHTHSHAHSHSQNSSQERVGDNQNGSEVAEHQHGVEPHTWNSTQNAHIIADNIYKAVSEIDPTNEAVYKHRLDSLHTLIDVTNAEVKQWLTDADKTFMIYHPALTYFARDYQLTQISIEEAGKEPSPAHLQQLIKTCKQYGTRIIFVQKEFDIHNAKMIAHEIGVEVVPINPLNYHWKEEMIQIAKSLSHNSEINQTNVTNNQ